MKQVRVVHAKEVVLKYFTEIVVTSDTFCEMVGDLAELFLLLYNLT